MSQVTQRPRQWLVVALAAVFVVAACGGDAPASPVPTQQPGASPTGAPSDEIGPAEKSTLMIGNRLPDVGSNAPFYIAIEEGYFAEEGLEIEVQIVDDVRAAVAAGSLDIGVMEVGPVAQAVNEGVDLVMFSGFRCREPYKIAIRPEIQSVADLDGKDILLGGVPGDPQADFRLQLLAKNGWDLSQASPNYVTVPGGSNAWVQLFQEGRLYITVFFGRHKGIMQDLGATIAVDEGVDWPNDVFISSRAWLAANPNAAARFIRAFMKATQFYKEDGNQDRVFEIMEKWEFNTELERQFYEGPILYCNNLYLESTLVQAQLEAQRFEDIPAFDEIADISQLLRAQAAMGVTNEIEQEP